MQGESDIDQMARVFRALGTPTERRWPGVSSLPDYDKIVFDDFAPQPMSSLLPGADARAVDLVQQCLRLDPEKRATPEDLLAHPFFAGGQEGVQEEGEEGEDAEIGMAVMRCGA